MRILEAYRDSLQYVCDELKNRVSKTHRTIEDKSSFLMPGYAKIAHMQSLVLINPHKNTVTMLRWPPNMPLL